MSLFSESCIWLLGSGLSLFLLCCVPGHSGWGASWGHGHACFGGLWA